MSAQLTISPFPPFDVRGNPSALGPRWTKYITRYENWLRAGNIKDDSRKRAMLLHSAGEEVQDIFDTLENTGEINEYELAVRKLTEYFTPKRNPVFEKFVFNEAKPQNGENIDNYYTRLYKLAATCDFADKEAQIITKIISNYVSKSMRQNLLSKPDLTLETMLQIIRTEELASNQAKQMDHLAEEPEMMVNAINKGYARPTNKSKYYPQSNKPTNKFHTQGNAQTKWNEQNNNNYGKQAYQANRNKQAAATQLKCRYCGGQYPHQGGKESCPAFGKNCNLCHKEGHFRRVCQSYRNDNKYQNKRSSYNQSGTQRVNQLQRYTMDDEQEEQTHVFAMQQESNIKVPKETIRVNGVNIVFLLDSCSSVDIIGEKILKTIKPVPEIRKTNTRIFPYGSNTPLQLIGCFNAMLEKNGIKYETILYVLPENIQAQSVLSYKTLQALNCTLDVSALQASEYENVLDKFPELFNGIGKMQNMSVKLHIDETVLPIAQPHRRIPFHIRNKVEKEIQNLLKEDIIEPVSGPTTWISPIVIVPKAGKAEEIRICIDMRAANGAIKRERHLTPTMDDLLYEINGAKYFSKLDLSKGYHQLELDPSSRDITTFSTHLGLFRYKRLFFGVSSAAEIFQKKIEDLIREITGTKNTSDDILVFGQTKEEHDKSLKQVLMKLSEAHLTLKRDKCVIGVQKLKFNGHIFSNTGIRPDPERIEIIKTLEPPKELSELKSLLGLLSYCSRFIQDFSTITAPLRNLTRQDVQWNWTKEHQNALEILKQHISTSALSYFDPENQTVLTVDASPYGLGAILAQEDMHGCHHVIAYASRTLSPTESRYSQTEREALAAVWSCEHFNLYLYGKNFTLVTDHKPLMSMLKKNTTKIPVSARIERWLLRLQAYNYDIEYRPGKDKPADYFSRHPKETKKTENDKVEEQVYIITNEARPKALSIKTLKEETKKDKTLQAVITAHQSGCWKKKQTPEVCIKTFQAMEKIAKELSVVDELLLKSDRLVLPTSLQEQAVKLAHEGHLGIIRTKKLLRDKIWFTGLDRMVKQEIERCIACQTQDRQVRKEPMKIMPVAPRAWSQISIDFCGPLPDDLYVLVVIDDFSKFPFAATLKSTSAASTTAVLNHLFSIFGIPDIVKSDNGPPFTSREFKEFIEEMGIQHRKITPYWPEANGLVERMMQSIMKAIRAAKIENKSWRLELENFLRNYRATLHPTTGKSPAELFLGRKMKIKLPEMYEEKEYDFQEKERSTKEKYKQRSDQRWRSKENNLEIGDNVLVRQKHINKFSTQYNPNPLKIVGKKGSMITATNNEKTITRNSSFFKLWKGKVIEQNLPESEENRSQQENQLEENKLNHDLISDRYSFRTNRKKTDFLIKTC